MFEYQGIHEHNNGNYYVGYYNKKGSFTTSKIKKDNIGHYFFMVGKNRQYLTELQLQEFFAKITGGI